MRAVLAAVGLLAAAAAEDPAPPVITLADCAGPVTGTWVTTPDGARVANFLSIPYAAPPVGELRWAPPAPPGCWPASGYNATQYKGVCIQQPGLGVEDCLYLHVHIPEAVYNGSIPGPVPVWFYIHGGGLMGGSGNFENPDTFLSKQRHGAVAVVINYRLNWAGWLATAELSATQGGASGNYGLMDQQAALAWAQRNVGSFGGDASRVTLGGQSSGGTSIFALMASPASRGLFRAAIALSGSPNISIALEQAHAQNAGWADAVGCGSAAGYTTPAAVVKCMRGVPAETLVGAIPASWNTPGMWGLELLKPTGMDYAGLPVVDGRVITASFEEAMAAGLNGNVTLVYGAMGQENDLAPDVYVGNFTQLQWLAYLNSSLAGWTPAFPDIALTIFREYANQSAIDVQLAYDSFNTDYGLICANARIAVGAKAGGAYPAPIYLYVNEWQPAHALGPIRWAYHTWDYSAAMENWPLGYTPGPTDLQLAAELQAIWGDIMAHGRLDKVRFGWRSVEDAAGFPARWGTYLMSHPSMWPYQASSTVFTYKADTCKMLAGFGFDARFWWCN